MTRHFQREIEILKKKILTLGSLVEETVRQATSAVVDRDGELARSIIDKDIDIDHMEVEIEEDCLKILALHQPVAIDLRFIIAVLKINNDLERIGDLAVNIAERAVYLAQQPEVSVSLDFPGMARKAKQMLKESLDALINLSPDLARKVCCDDEEVDNLNRQIYVRVQEGIRQYPHQIESLIHLLSVSRHLERIADHATNIAEDIIYMVQGQIVRHKAEIYTQHHEDNS
ncbi:MAG: phosphate signaling complex protein PhoU [Sedimentisphaerales bacterium]|nr:phosphate signaling complex protein PhoU [Sedimentisphaerales bacterium]